MNKRKLRSRLAGAASIGVVAVTSMMLLGTSAAFAAPGDPPFETAPHFYNGNVSAIRDSGSDTTFFMMQKIGDLYTGAGLYGCQLNDATGETMFNSGDSDSSTSTLWYYCKSGTNIDTTDVNDNWDRTEVSEGVDDVGSGAGQSQLCANLSTPLAVDFSRSSKPVTTTCSNGDTLVGTGYAKDGVPLVTLPTVNPSTYGTSTFHDTTSGVNYASINGGVVGPVADGWLPGDPVAGPYNGDPWTDISNDDNGGGASSTVYRLYCATDSTRITDWGNLTNRGPKIELVHLTVSGSNVTINAGAPEGTTFSMVANGDAVTGPGVPAGTTISSGAGTATLTLNHTPTASSDETLTFTTGTMLSTGDGIPDGIPVRVVGVNTASGTEATFASYAKGTASSGCSTTNSDAAADPNSLTGSTTSAHVALENDVAQLGQFAQGDFPSDLVDQAIELSTSMYFISNGAYNTDPYDGEAQITNGTNTFTFTSVKLSENEGKTTTTPNLLNNVYPTARTLYNIYNTTTLRASVAGFLNWTCDSNTDFTKGTDNSTGLNEDTELTTIISGNFGFIRLSDTSAAPTIATPADQLAAPNTTCASGTVVNGGGQTVGNGTPPITSSGAINPAGGVVPTANLNS